MKSIRLTVFLLSVILVLSGCLTTNKNKNANKNIETREVDLDGDTFPETIEIENRFITDGNALVRITKGVKNKKITPKAVSFEIPGNFKKIEFIDLNDDGLKQMAVYFDARDNSSNVTIYKLKNDKVSKIFYVSSNCEIETDFTSILARVRINKDINGGNDCSLGTSGEWEVWVYNGEKFIKER